MDEAEKVVAEADSLPGLSAPQRKSMLENLHFHVGDIEEGTFGEEMERIGIVSTADERGNREVLAPPPVKD